MDLQRNAFKNFMPKAFRTLNPGHDFVQNWYLDVMMRAISDIASGKVKRLIISMPPRCMKSMCASVACPSWLLGMNPGMRIIVASYSLFLAEKFTRESELIMRSEWFKNSFPNVHIASSNANRIVTETNGFRLATSVGGSLTGEGADLLIVDDIHKPITIGNKAARDKAHEWFSGTFCSRLNDQKNGAIIVVMQRLHNDDIIFRLTQYQSAVLPFFITKNGWHVINFKAIDFSDPYASRGKMLLSPRFLSISTLASIKEEMGSHVFNTQYQQNPMHGYKSYITKKSIAYHNRTVSDFDRIYISVDCASKTAERSDFSSFTIWGTDSTNSVRHFYILECHNVKLALPDLITYTKSLVERCHPYKILIEDTSNGTGLIQMLMQYYAENAIVSIRPKLGKEARLLSIISLFERGCVFLCHNSEISAELLSFPNGIHDDIVDSITQFLNWYKENDITPNFKVRLLE